MKRMRSFFFSPRRPTSSSSSTSLEASPPSSLLHSPSKSMMNETIRNAEEIINRWNPDTSTHAQVTSLFYGSKIEALDFVKCVGELHTAMQSLISLDPSSEMLIQAQSLIHIAMKRLEKEFSQILSSNRDHLDPESISGRSSLTSRSSISSDYEGSIESLDDIQVASNSITDVENEAAAAMSDLKMIADCMISCGYGKECVDIYKSIRKSIVDEGLFRLGIEPINPKRIHKMDWEVIELKIKNWLSTVNVAVKTLFCGERILCDYVFSISNSIKESCFSEISRGAALSLFQFPELVLVKTKRHPERIFIVLDLYSTISNLWQEIESISSFESTSVVRSQALSSLIKLGESVRKMLTKFESAIQKDSSTTPVKGGGIHPLTEHVMDYLSSLADYSKILPDIVTDWKLPIGTSLPDSYFQPQDSSSSISVRFAWLILILLSKLDVKAELYKDVSLSYLFLANNLQFIVTRVRRSNLQFILGEDWISKQEANVKQFAAKYEQIGWHKVLSALSDNPLDQLSPEEATRCFNKFNLAFEAVYQTQSSWIVPDSKLREEIKISISKKVMLEYQMFYETNREALREEKNLQNIVRFVPDDLENYLSDLFYGGVSASFSSSKYSSHR